MSRTMLTRRAMRACIAIAALFAFGCSGPDPLISVSPVDSQGAASLPLPNGARLIVRTGNSDSPESYSTSAYVTPYSPDSGVLMVLRLEARDGGYFADSVSGAYAGQAREYFANGLRAIQSRSNPDAFLLQFNNIGQTARDSMQEAGHSPTQAVAILPGMRRCTARTCALWLFSGSALRVASETPPEAAAPAPAADPAATPAEGATDVPAETTPAPAPVEDYGLRGGYATTAAGVGQLWARALAQNRFDPGDNSIAVFLYRPSN